MRIDSMDANFKPTVSIEPSPPRHDVTNDSGRSESVKAGAQSKEAAYNKSGKVANSQAPILAEEKISDAFLQSSIDKVNHTFEIQRRSVRFKIHEKTNDVMVKIVDAETEEVIREIPPEKLLDMFANMLELAGLLVDERR